ncbi:MAG: hypothetical protein H7840_05765 [Alphaproteobacteria bacterium]
MPGVVIVILLLLMVIVMAAPSAPPSPAPSESSVPTQKQPGMVNTQNKSDRMLNEENKHPIGHLLFECNEHNLKQSQDNNKKDLASSLYIMHSVAKSKCGSNMPVRLYLEGYESTKRCSINSKEGKSKKGYDDKLSTLRAKTVKSFIESEDLNKYLQVTSMSEDNSFSTWLRDKSSVQIDYNGHGKKISPYISPTLPDDEKLIQSRRVDVTIFTKCHALLVCLENKEKCSPGNGSASDSGK